MSSYEWNADQAAGEMLLRELREVAERNARDAGHLRRSCISLENDLKRVRAHNMRLREALARYGDHDSECYLPGKKKCICGLHEALREDSD